MLEKLKRRNNNKAFTLVELSVVIAIIIILLALAIPKLKGFTDQARIAADRSSIHTINNAILLHTVSNNFTDIVGQTSMNVPVPIKNNDSVTVIVQFLKDKGLLEPTATIYFPIAHQYSATDNKVN